jgi:membrane-associated phospholipid phosphatase
LSAVGAALFSYVASAERVSTFHRTPGVLHTLLNLIQSLDLGVYYFLSRFHGNWVLDRLASKMEANLLIKAAPIVALLWYFWFIDDRDQEERRGKILAILAGTLIGIIVTRMVAAVTPFRIRPVFDSNLLQRAFSMSISCGAEQWNSFPSDTAAYLVAMGAGIVWLRRRLLVPIALFLALWICLPRLYLGYHYLSDVIVGAGIGVAAVWFTLRSRWLQSQLAPRLVRFSHSKPQLFYAMAFLITFELASVFWATRQIVRSFLHLASLVPKQWS